MTSNDYSMGGICARASDGSFVTTHWSQVALAGETTSTGSKAALEQLCKDYWYPLYSYVRRQGHDVQDAQDLTQEFFARLLEKKYVRRADRARGRFRSFLLTSLKHFLINEWSKANNQRRGGGNRLISFDIEKTESRFLTEAADSKSPDRLFDKQWALVLLDRVLERLDGEFARQEREAVFAALKPFLTGEDPGSYAAIARRLGMTEGHVKVTIHRLRRHYRELLRDEIARTLVDPGTVDDEMRELFAALSDSA